MPNHHHKRTDLFLVRVWTQDGNSESSESYSDGSFKVRCHGKVQRVVSGEAREFDNWQGLLNELMAMVADARGDKPPEMAKAKGGEV